VFRWLRAQRLNHRLTLLLRREPRQVVLLRLVLSDRRLPHPLKREHGLVQPTDQPLGVQHRHDLGLGGHRDAVDLHHLLLDPHLAQLRRAGLPVRLEVEVGDHPVVVELEAEVLDGGLGERHRARGERKHPALVLRRGVGREPAPRHRDRVGRVALCGAEAGGSRCGTCLVSRSER
jgi:hypothetical protein